MGGWVVAHGSHGFVWEELINEIKKAVPDTKFENLKKLLSEKVDLSWLIDQTTGAKDAKGERAKPSKTVYVLSFDGDPTAAGVELLAKEVTAVLERTKSRRPYCRP